MFLALVALGGWVLWLIFRRQQVHVQARMKRTEVFDHLIEKFSTSQEFIEFLKTDQGKKFVEDPLLLPQSNPSRAVLRFVQVGIVFAAISVAFLLNWLNINHYVQTATNPDINEIRKVMDYYYWAMLSLTLAGGMFLIAAVTRFLAKRWNLNGSHGR